MTKRAHDEAHPCPLAQEALPNFSLSAKSYQFLISKQYYLNIKRPIRHCPFQVTLKLWAYLKQHVAEFIRDQTSKIP